MESSDLRDQIQMVRDEAYYLTEQIQSQTAGANEDGTALCNAETAAVIIRTAELAVSLVSRDQVEKQREDLERKMRERQDALTLELKTFVPMTDSSNSALVIRKLCQDAAADIEQIVKDSVRAYDPQILATWTQTRDELRLIWASGKN